MEVILHTEPFHYLEVTGVWTEQERTEMFNEMLHFESNSMFLPPKETSTSIDEDGKEGKQNSGIFIDSIFQNREHSTILKHNRKVFDVFSDNVIKDSWYFDSIHTDADSTLVSYYENSDYYHAHKDKSVYSAVSWFFKEPKKFLGGEISFTDYDITFEVTNNLTIIFPSNITHEVSKVSIAKSHVGKQSGRFCMSQFVNNKGGT
jgi:hypothetical protein